MREGGAWEGVAVDWRLAIGHWLMANGFLPKSIRLKLGGMELKGGSKARKGGS